MLERTPRSVLLVALLVWPVLVGATCSPSEPGCPHGTACEGITQPGRSCINFCAPLFRVDLSPEALCDSNDEDADGFIDEACPPLGSAEDLCLGEDDDADGNIDEGCVPIDFCPLDPCDEGAFERPDVVVCADGYYCRSIPFLWGDRFGRCFPAEAEFGEPCDPYHPDGSRCSAGTYCALSESPRAQDWLSLTGAEDTLGGICLTPRREGSPCDSNLATIEEAVTAGETVFDPCEAGAACVSEFEAGWGSDPQRRCMRLCEDSKGGPSNTYCACDVSECAAAEPVVDPHTGASLGAHLCTPCDSNFGSCSQVDEQDCCDPNADCLEALVDVPTERYTTMCCWSEGTTGCAVGGTDQCCPGTVCRAGAPTSCQPCAREGDDEEIGCCPGYARFRAFDGPIPIYECRRCRAYGFTCSDERFDVVYEDGHVDNVTVPDTNQRWTNRALGAGGDLSRPAESPVRAIYDLTDQHRAYLFPHPLASPPGTLSSTWSAVLMPQNFPPGTLRDEPVPSSVPTPTGTGANGIVGTTDVETKFQSVRVYDVGACSYLVRWPILVNVLAMEVNKALEDLDWGLFGAEPFVPVAYPDGTLAFSVRPMPSAAPQLSYVLPRGPLVDDDRMAIHAEYDTASMLGCPSARLLIDATVRISPQPALMTTQKALDEDALMAMVGCVVSPDGSDYECTLPSLSGVRPERSFSGNITLQPQTFPRPNSDDDFMMLDPTHGVRCNRRAVRYECVIPYELYEGGLSTYLQTFNRALYESVEAVDWNIELEYFNAYVADVCSLEDLIPGLVRPLVDARLEAFRDRLGTILRNAFGDSFTDDFSISADRLATCGDPVAGADPLACQGSFQFGGRRHGCSTSVTNSAGDFVCDAARLEIRRMFVRPEGIEVVFAEGADDPQFNLLNGRPGVIVDDPADDGDLASVFLLIDPSAGPSLDWAFDQDPALCDPLRWTAPGTGPALPRGVFDWRASSLVIPGGLEICDETDASCEGLCGQFGNECNQVRDLGLDVLLTGTSLPPGPLVCSNGTCVVAP